MVKRYCMVEYKEEVSELVQASCDWPDFKVKLLDKYQLGDQLLDLADLRKVSRRKFGTAKQFLTEFERVARLVSDLPDKDRCLIFLENFSEVEQRELMKDMTGRYDWPRIKENLLAGSFDQMLYRLLKQQKEDREKEGVSADKDQAVYKTLTDMRNMMADMKEERLKLQVMMVQTKGGKRKGKAPVVEEVSGSSSEEEDEEEEEPSRKLTKAEGKALNQIRGGQGTSKKQRKNNGGGGQGSNQEQAAPTPPQQPQPRAGGRGRGRGRGKGQGTGGGRGNGGGRDNWQNWFWNLIDPNVEGGMRKEAFRRMGRDLPATFRLPSPEEVEQIELEATMESLTIEAAKAGNGGLSKGQENILQRAQTVIGKMKRCRKTFVQVCADMDEEWPRLPQVFLLGGWDRDGQRGLTDVTASQPGLSSAGRLMATTILSRPALKRPATAGLPQARRARRSPRPRATPEGGPSQPRETETISIEEDDGEEDELLRAEDERQAKQRAVEREPETGRADVGEGELKKKKQVYTIPVEQGMGIEQIVDRILESQRDLFTLKEFLAAFWGTCGFWRIFIRKFAARVKHLRKLVRKNQEWEWGPRQQAAVDDIKAQFREGGLILGVPCFDNDPNRPFVVETDAGPTALGGVLIQKDGEGRERLLRFESRMLNEAERKYSQFKKETLAVLHCFKIFRNYVFGRRFVLRVDPTALAQSLRNYSPSDPTIARWLIYIWMFDFEIKRIAGAKNRADGLSRIEWDSSKDQAEDSVPVDGFLEADEQQLTWADKFEQLGSCCEWSSEKLLQMVKRYCMVEYKEEVSELVQASCDWPDFKVKLLDKYQLGDQLLDLADLRKVSRRKFGTAKQFLTEFERVARLVSDLPDKDRCLIFLENFSEVEQRELMKDMTGRYDWPRIKENLLAGSFDQMLYRLLKQQKEDREKEGVSADKDQAVYKTLTDMRNMMADMKEERLKLQVMMVQTKGGKRKGKAPVVEEVSGSSSEEEDEEEEEPSRKLTKAEGKALNQIRGGQGTSKKQRKNNGGGGQGSNQEQAAPTPPQQPQPRAGGRGRGRGRGKGQGTGGGRGNGGGRDNWQNWFWNLIDPNVEGGMRKEAFRRMGRDLPATFRLPSPEEVEQIELEATMESLTIEAAKAGNGGLSKGQENILQRAQTVIGKMKRCRKTFVQVCADMDEEWPRLPQVFLLGGWDRDGQRGLTDVTASQPGLSSAGRLMATTILSRPALKRPATAGLPQARRARRSPRPRATPEGGPSQPRETETISIEEDDGEEDELLRAEDERQAKQRAVEREPETGRADVGEGELKKKKQVYTIPVEQGMGIEQIVDRILESQRDLFTLKEFLAASPKI
ncbi:hypothetical protein CBR_g53968 [Chara braunii]|uniref:Reverse transcriptase RNase H-like domain-containing protein n=1 Tax=Chara braunii TaxID=69332 RepID=A0A388MBS8_CHABU|nr:hypothetical protein CBR_g53968 [Chara braunii]|eukprot:GBG91909.1 hypothetical protein CBR_g53968 [Chara braunii]